jgi:hypothetical protein
MVGMREELLGKKWVETLGLMKGNQWVGLLGGMKAYY